MVYDFKKKKNIIINRIKGLFSKVNGKFKNSLKHGKKEKLDCLSEKNIIIERVKKDIAIIRKSVCKNKEFSNYEKNEKTVNGEKNEKTVKEKRKLFFLTEKIKQTKVYFFLEKYYAQIFLAALILFHTIVNWWWLSVDTLPPGWDQAGHLIESLKIYEIFTHPSIDIFSRLAEVSNYYPPFFEICTVPFYLLFGISDDVAIMTNILFLGILILSVYGIGKKMYNKKTGLFSAFLVSFYPIIFGHLREYLMDVSLTAMVTLSIYLLLKTDYFNNRMYSMLFGISLGLGMLTKWTFVFFICPAILLIIFGLIIKNTNINEVKLNFKSYFFNRIKLFFISKKTRNLLLLSLIGFLIASFWYVPNYDSVKSLLLGHSSDSGAIEGDPEIFTLKSITWYFVGLINHNIFLPFFIVFLIGLFFLIKNISNNKIRTSILLLWILIPWGVFTFIRNKDIRYIMPLLPAIAIISSFWIMNLKKKTIKSLVVLSIVIIALFQFVLITSGVSWLPHEDTISTPIGDLKIYSQHVHVTHHPKAEDWKIEEILANINELNYFRPVICIVPNNYRFMNSNFKYYLELNNYSFISKNIRTNKYEKNLYYCDFIITKSENQGPSFTTKYIEKAMIYIDSNPLIFNDTFTIFEKHSLPDSSVSKIYRRVIPRIKILENKTNLKYNYDIIFENISFKGMNISKKYLENKIYLNIIYCWKSLNKIDKDWVAFVHFTDKNGKILFQQDHHLAHGLYEPSEWNPKDTIQENYVVEIPGNVELKDISMRMGLWHPETGMHLNITTKFVSNDNTIILGKFTNGTFHKYEPPEIILDKLPKIQYTTSINFDNKIEFLGYNLLEENNKLNITYYWKSLNKTDKDWVAFVHFTDKKGKLLFQNDHHLAYGLYEPSEWNQGDIIQENYVVEIPKDVELNEISMRMGLWHPQTGERLNITTMFVSNNNEVKLGEFINNIFYKYEPPKIILKELQKIQHNISVNFDNKIEFLGYHLSEKDNKLNITYYWKSLNKTDKDWVAFVHFTDKNGKLLFQNDHRLAYGLYEPSQWNPEDIIQENYIVEIPEDVELNDTVFGLGLWHPETKKRMIIANNFSNIENKAILFGNLEGEKNNSNTNILEEIDKSKYLVNDTNIENKMFAFFDNKIAFLGYDINQTILKQGDVFNITYYWKCIDKIEKDYIIFVHFTDEKEKMIFQQDHRPPIQTSQWNLGDIIRESYVVKVPENIDRSIINIGLGWWYSETGKRLDANIENNKIIIETIEVK